MRLIELIAILQKYDPDESVCRVFQSPELRGVIEPTFTSENEKRHDVIKPTITSENEKRHDVIKPTVTSENEKRHEVIKPTVTSENEKRHDVIEPTVTSENEKKGRKDTTGGRAGRASKALVQVESQLSASLVLLMAEWATNPEKFSESWSLEPEASEVSSDLQPKPDQLTSWIDGPVAATDGPIAQPLADLKSVLDQKTTQMKEILSRRHEDNIRLIFNAVFFRDLFMLFTSRQDSEDVLPKGKTLASQAAYILSQLFADDLQDDFVNWVKIGQLYHLVGSILGEGSWFVLADHLTMDSMIQNLPRAHSNLAKTLQPLKKRIADVENVSQAHDAAIAIRKFQRPHQLFLSNITVETRVCPSSSLDSVAPSSVSGLLSSCPSSSSMMDLSMVSCEPVSPKRKRQAIDGHSEPSKKNCKDKSSRPSQQSSEGTQRDQSIRGDLLCDGGHPNMPSEPTILNLNEDFGSFEDFNFEQDLHQFDDKIYSEPFNFDRDLSPFEDLSQILGPFPA